MVIQERRVGTVTILALKGRLVLDDGDVLLRERVDALVSRGEVRIVIDFSDLDYVDSAGIGVLIGKYLERPPQRGKPEAAPPLHARASRPRNHAPPHGVRDVRRRRHRCHELLGLTPGQTFPAARYNHGAMRAFVMFVHLALLVLSLVPVSAQNRPADCGAWENCRQLALTGGRAAGLRVVS